MRRLVAIVIGLVGACTPQLPHATSADASRANVALAELEDGRTVVASKCSACHKPPRPTDAWQPHMDDMAKRAKLTADQRRLAEQYLTVLGTK